MSTASFDIRIKGSTADTMNKKAAALERLASAMLKLNGSLGTTTGSTTKAATGGLAKYNKAAKTAAARTDAFGTKIRGTGHALDNFRTLFVRMVRIMTAFLIIRTLTRAVRGFVTELVKAPAQMQLWSTQLRTLTRNATLAAESLDLLKTVAIETPLELPDLFQGLVTLKAFNVEISERTLPLLADLAAVSGQTFKAVSAVVGKVIQGSKPAVTRSLPTLGIDPKEFRRLEAELGNRADAIFAIIKSKFEGFARESALTVIGVLSNIKDAFFVVMAEVGKTLVPLFADALGGVMDWLQALRNNQSALTEFSIKVRMAGDDVLGFVRVIFEAGRFLVNMTSKVLDARGAIVLTGAALTVVLIPAIYKLLASLSLLNLILTALAVVVGFGIKKYDDLTKRFRENEMAATILGERLKELRRLGNININLVDAAEVADANRQVTELFNRARDIRAILLSRKHLMPVEFESLITSAKNLGDALGDTKLSGLADAMGSLSTLGEGPVIALTLLMHRLGEIQREYGALTVAAGEAADAMRGSLGGDQGDDATAISPLRKMRASLALLTAAFKDGDIARAAYVRGLGEIEAAATEQFQTMRSSSDTATQEMASGFFALAESARKAFSDITESWADTVQALASGALADVKGAKAKFELGIIDRDALLAEMANATVLLQDLFVQMATVGGEGAAKVRQAILDGLVGLKDDMAELLGGDDSISGVVKRALLKTFKDLADATAEVIASLGQGSTERVQKALAGVLNTFGDALIQMGIAKVGWDALIKSIVAGVPGGGAVAIAAGIALKALAKRWAAGVGDAATGGSSSQPSTRPQSGAFPQFSSSQRQVASTVNIYALDSQSFEQFVGRNPAAFAAGVQRMATDDRNTGGLAYGVFLPQGA